MGRESGAQKLNYKITVFNFNIITDTEIALCLNN